MIREKIEARLTELGYTFDRVDRPYIVYKKSGIEIGFCIPCMLIKVNETRIKVRSGQHFIDIIDQANGGSAD